MSNKAWIQVSKNKSTCRKSAIDDHWMIRRVNDHSMIHWANVPLNDHWLNVSFNVHFCHSIDDHWMVHWVNDSSMVHWLNVSLNDHWLNVPLSIVWQKWTLNDTFEPMIIQWYIGHFGIHEFWTPAPPPPHPHHFCKYSLRARIIGLTKKVIKYEL